MKAAKPKTYVLMIAKNFLSDHSKAGKPTGFERKIVIGIKRHTIRMDYDSWKEKIDEVNAGKAILSLRQWTGKPYRSKQNILLELSKAGIQKIEWGLLGWFIDDIDTDYTASDFAENDGLHINDFKNWFKGTQGMEMAIIHFTDFRY